MNSLANKIVKNFEDNVKIEESKKGLKFNVLFEESREDLNVLVHFLEQTFDLRLYHHDFYTYKLSVPWDRFTPPAI